MPASKVKNQKEKVKTTTKKSVARKTGQLSVPVYSLTGKKSGSLDLPEGLFGQKVNQPLLAQAIRVYTTNQKAHWAHTKTRGEVSLTTAKWYKQKGTGRARHGAKSAPIFVGGGIALGPKYRKTVLELPKKMRTKALLSALSQKAKDQEVLGLSGLEKASGKTKEMVQLGSKVKSQHGLLKKQSILIVTGDKNDLAVRAVKNIKGMDVLPAYLVNTLEIIGHQSLLLTKEAVEKLQERLIK